jgi:hypothetical protein
LWQTEQRQDSCQRSGGPLAATAIIAVIIAERKIKEYAMSEEPDNSSYTFYESAELQRHTKPLAHRDGSVEHEYIVAISPDLPPVKLRVFTFPNGDAQVEAEFDSSAIR